MPTKYLHSMIRVTDPDATVDFFKLIGLEEVRRFDVDDLAVRAPTLEDVFLNITGRRLRD